MTVLPFLAIAATSGTLSLLARSSRGWSTLIALVGLAGMAVSASWIATGASIDIGGAGLVGSDWLRLFAVLGSVVGLLLVLVDVTALHEPDAPGVIVLGLGAAVLALSAADPGIAVISATAGGLAGILVAAPVGAAERAAYVGTRELRAVAVSGTLAILATAWVARPLDDVAGSPAAFGIAYLAFGVAVAIRFGEIPFHLWAARVADAAPGVALPLLMAWGPAALAAIALTWVDQSVAPLVVPLSTERAVVASVGAVSILLGLLAAWVQDDLEHVIGYTIVSDAGFVVLGLAVFEPSIWEPTRTWLLVFAVCRSALAAWVVALHGGFGTRRIPELAGWARRRPVLGVALAAVAASTIGWPGLVAWDVRSSIAALALPGPIAALCTIAPLAGIAIYGRLALAGVARPGVAVEAGATDRPGWPVPWPSRTMVGLSPTERAFERTRHAASATLDVLWTLPAAARWNRVPIASIVVLILAGLAAAVAAGGLGVPAAARAAPVVEPGPQATPTPTPSAAASEVPIASQPPAGVDASPSVSLEPIGSGDAASPPGSISP